MEFRPLPSENPEPVEIPAKVSTPETTSKKGTKAGISGLLAGIAAKLAIALKSLAFLAKFKVMLSMLVSVVAYSFIFGWLYALGFVLLILIHEMGHVVALKSQGIKASAPMFIPFLGAFVTMKEQPKTATQEAISGVAGPVTGTVAALLLYAVAHSSGSHLLLALSYAGFFINLFNLLPFLPLDGGRTAAALHPALWAVGLVGAVALFFYLHSFIIILIILFGLLEIYSRWRRGEWFSSDYYKVDAKARLYIGLTYLATAGVCLWGMIESYVPR